MRIYNINPTNQITKQSTTNFKGLWGNNSESQFIDEETMYGGEVSVRRYSMTQDYHPFRDETPQMTEEAINHHSYIENVSGNYTNVETTTINAIIKPKLAITAQQFIDYLTGAMGKDFNYEAVEKVLKEANLTKYIRTHKLWR